MGTHSQPNPATMPVQAVRLAELMLKDHEIADSRAESVFFYRFEKKTLFFKFEKNVFFTDLKKKHFFIDYFFTDLKKMDLKKTDFFTDL